MNNKFLSVLAIISILFAVFMAWQKFAKDQNDIILEPKNQTEIKQEVFKVDAVVVGFGDNSIILDINGQRRIAKLDDSVQIYLYKQKTEEILAQDLQKAVEQGLAIPESGEYVQKTKNDLLPYSKISIESKNDLLQSGDIILFKIIIKE
jgi:hypothetical protein